jgi:hypothetical protein
MRRDAKSGKLLSLSHFANTILPNFFRERASERAKLPTQSCSEEKSSPKKKKQKKQKKHFLEESPNAK